MNTCMYAEDRGTKAQLGQWLLQVKSEWVEPRIDRC
jgi:hypothetical protein